MRFACTSARIGSAFRSLSDELARNDDRCEGLERLVTVARDVVPGCTGVSLAAVPRPAFARTVAVTDPVAQRVDDLQYAAAQGPGLQAAAEKATVLCADLATESRWSDFCARAVSESPVRSVMSLGVSSAAGDAAVNLYGQDRDAFGSDAGQVAALVAVLAQGLINQLDAQARAAQLQEALESNRTIGMAVGLLLARHGGTPAEALDRLRRWSMDHNVKLVTVAHMAVRAGGLPTSPIAVPARFVTPGMPRTA